MPTWERSDYLTTEGFALFGAYTQLYPIMGDHTYWSLLALQHIRYPFAPTQAGAPAQQSAMT